MERNLFEVNSPKAAVGLAGETRLAGQENPGLPAPLAVVRMGVFLSLFMSVA